MKKTSKILWGIVAIVVIIVLISITRSSSNKIEWKGKGGDTSTSTSSPAISETVKISDKVTEYKNAELGIALKYPSSWEKSDTETGASFIIPIEEKQVSTIGKLQADIIVNPGKCSFPPITTIKDRSTLDVGGMTLNSISMSNTVQGRSYFNRMYSLQKDSVCYMFTFSAIATDPVKKNLSGSNLTQAQNNNKAIINTADSAFISMVKSFTFVAGPQGQDESKVSPQK